MPVLPSLTLSLAAGRDLAGTEVESAAAALAAPETPDAEKEAFLTALTAKGESAAELAAFAAAFRARAINPRVESWAGRAIDIVGTGGDHAGGFNISSLVTLVLASGGVIVMKHGNRGITSKCGSADLLAGLGVNLEATPEQVRRALDQLGYAFFFAPVWHPAFKAIGPTRKALAARGMGPITTEILDAPTFYYAEDYHQQYLAKNPGGYCGLGGTGVACPIGVGVAAQ